MKTFVLSVTASIIIALSLVVMPLGKVLADDPCNVSEQTYGIIQTVQNFLDIRRTVTNMFASLVTDAALTTIVHANPDQLMKCGSYAKGDGVCTLTDEEKAVCNSLFNTYSQVQVRPAGGTGYVPQYKNNITSGSLLGVAYSLERGIKEPLPVNLAYFVQDEIKDFPFLNKAFAQTYQGPLLGNNVAAAVILGMWKLLRNIAYGLMSVFLIIIGIMMILRKKVDQQTVVNIQYALPKIIMVLILIPFSYPIGATIASAGWTAMQTAIYIVSNTITSALGGVSLNLGNIAQADIGIGIAITLIFLASLNPIGGSIAAGVGIATLSILALLTLMIIVMFLWYLLRILIIYVKLIVALISSPLVFAIGAIPGNESKITDWFKTTLAQALSLPAMAAVSYTGLRLSIGIISGSNASSGIDVVLGLLIAPFLIIFSLYYAGKMPEKIEAAIVGEPKKGGKR